MVSKPRSQLRRTPASLTSAGKGSRTSAATNFSRDLASSMPLASNVPGMSTLQHKGQSQVHQGHRQQLPSVIRANHPGTITKTSFATTRHSAIRPDSSSVTQLNHCYCSSGRSAFCPNL